MSRVPVCSFAIVLVCLVICNAALTQAFAETVLYSFQNNGIDGQTPEAALLDLQGALYGTTISGGTYGNGTIFSLNPKTGAELTVYSFQNGTDGVLPAAGLINVKGTLYGTTEAGGDGACESLCGTVFSFDPATGAEKVVYSFCSMQNCADGAIPNDLIEVKGMLFGSTSGGGYPGCDNYGCGTVFSIEPATGRETVVHSFCSEQGCADGSRPQSGFADVNGTLYGTTEAGGAYGAGTIFSIDPKSGAEKVVYSFPVSGADSSGPTGALIYVDGIIYGTSTDGGKRLSGTVFSFDPETGAESVLYSFCSRRNCKDGFLPDAGVIDVNGILYGTTVWGGNQGCGSNGCGVVFSLNPQTGAEKMLYSFCKSPGCADGASPVGGLLYRSKKLYGTTEQGGSGACDEYLTGCGTIFEVKP